MVFVSFPYLCTASVKKKVKLSYFKLEKPILVQLLVKSLYVTLDYIFVIALLGPLVILTGLKISNIPLFLDLPTA